jgi:hypothetical protein
MRIIGCAPFDAQAEMLAAWESLSPLDHIASLPPAGAKRDDEMEGLIEKDAASG